MAIGWNFSFWFFFGFPSHHHFHRCSVYLPQVVASMTQRVSHMIPTIYQLYCINDSSLNHPLFLDMNPPISHNIHRYPPSCVAQKDALWWKILFKWMIGWFFPVIIHFSHDYGNPQHDGPWLSPPRRPFWLCAAIQTQSMCQGKVPAKHGRVHRGKNAGKMMGKWWETIGKRWGNYDSPGWILDDFDDFPSWKFTERRDK